MKPSLSIEELLAKAGEKTKKRLRSESNANTLRYVSEVGWEAGTYAVPTYALFYHYRSLWAGDKSSKANKVVFFRTFNKRFPTFRKNHQRYYLLNEGVIEITEQLLKEAKSYDKNYWSKAPKKVRSVEQKGDDIDQACFH